MCGIGTSGRVIVHTLTCLASLNLEAIGCGPCCGVCYETVIVNAVPGPTKTELRAQILLTRRRLAAHLHDAEAQAVCGHLPGFIGDGETVCAYVPVGGEPGSIELIDSLLQRAVRVLLPVARHNPAGLPLTLLWGEYRPGGLVRARFGLL